MLLIDSHCHFDDSRFDEDRELVLQRAADNGVQQFVVPAVSRSGWQRLEQLAAQYPAIHPAYGLHPWFEHSDEDIALLPAYLEKSVAIGECGLDFKLSSIDEAAQLKHFRAQIKLAVEYDLPLIIHAYKAVDQVIRELKRYPGLRGVIHSFSGSSQQAEQLIDLGFHLGFGAAATRSNAVKLHQIIADMPLEKLLLETDAPDQPPASHRGERNEPAYLVEIARAIANIRALPAEALAEQCNRNCQELFGL